MKKEHEGEKKLLDGFYKKRGKKKEI